MIKPFYQDSHITVFNKSCTDMSELPDESVQMCVTSPPYWGLRKYSGNQDLIWDNVDHCEHEWISARTMSQSVGGSDKQRANQEPWFAPSIAGSCSLCHAWHGSYGLEPTPELYIQHTVEILREIRRVLRKDGVVFWNIGDSYAGSMSGRIEDNKSAGKGTMKTSLQMDRPSATITKSKRIERGTGRWCGGNLPASGILKPKDLCLIPFRVAIAAQNDGWWVRSVIIWNKPNPMPESVKDRPTESHEYILLLTKSANYYWNQEAVLEPIAESTISRGPVAFGGTKGKEYNPGPSDPNFRNGSEQWGRVYDYRKSSRKMADADNSVGGNGTGFQGHSGNHDADGELLGNPLGRNVRSVWTFPTMPYRKAHFATFPEALPERCIKAGSKEGDLVLDPFAGSGTTLWVAKRLNRKAVGYEISDEYCELIIDRNRQQVIL